MRKSSAPSHAKRSVNSILALLDQVKCDPPLDNEPDFQEKSNISISTPQLMSNSQETLPTEHKYRTLPLSPQILTAQNHSVVKEEKCLGISSNNMKVRFKVVWGKPSTKKHKTWEGDGVLELTDKSAVLLGEDGNILSTKNLLKPLQVDVGQIITIGSKVVEVIEAFNEEPTLPAHSNKRKSENDSPSFKASKIVKKRSFSSPMANSSNICHPVAMKNVEQIVLPNPPSSHQWKHNSSKRPVCPVKVDPFLSLRLRPHQRDGLIFLYTCVMSFLNQFSGAILADEMGLGKTLQCIALIWTLLKHGPYGVPVIKKVLVIAPSTLCGTWQKEFLKWLGRERLIPFVVDNSCKPQSFKSQPNKPVMIISYERFVKHADEIKDMQFDMIICDEAHRLKNANIKAVQALHSLDCKKRILLTGTPIQNDLQEYFVLIDIANPGILGTYNDFKEEFVNPILASQKPNCSEEETAAGEHTAAHLQLLTSSFILRRTQTLLKDYLPTKTECVLCCKITKMQEDLYMRAIDSWWSERELGPCSVSPLSLIVLLKKICNYPHLVKKVDPEEDASKFSFLGGLLPPEPEKISEECSGKLAVLASLLKEIVLIKREKLVIVSCSTQMLDVLAKVCKKYFVTYSRLDGSTPVSSRQTLVEGFNSHGGPPVLLLSSRAGGTGLSLPSASRLLLYDSDWNPAVDHQAMARIWRDGQRKPVFIYRLLITGTIEEKIYQRQMFKTGLSDAVSDPQNMKTTLKLCDEELKELFVANLDTESTTHDVLQCKCEGDGSNQEIPELSLQEDEDALSCGRLESSSRSNLSSINQLKTWDHIRPTLVPEMLKEFGLGACGEIITFIFKKTHLKMN